MITVLLADDHTMVREGLRFLLEEPGDIHIDATAANGQEAVDHAMQHCPDVAVIDVSMPVMDMFWGDRCDQVTDPDGNKWMIATHKAEPSEAEMAEAMRRMSEQPQATAAAAGSESEY